MLFFAAQFAEERQAPGSTFLQRLPVLTAGAVLAICLLVLTGWAFDSPVLRRLHPQWPAMPLTTAFGLVLVAVSFAAVRVLNLAARSIIGYGFAIPVLVLGMIGSSEFLAGGQVLPGSLWQRISPSATVNFVLVAGALILLHRRDHKRILAACAALAGLVSLLAITGHLYGVKGLYTMGPYAAMPPHAALSFLLLCVGILFVQPGKGLAAMAISPAIEGALVRRLLPATVLIPLVLGWIALKGWEANLYEETLGTALLAVSMIVTLMVLLWWSARAIGRIDAMRQSTTEELRKSEASLGRAQSIASLGSWEADILLPDRGGGERYRWSDEVYRIFGVDRQTFIPTRQAFLAAIHPDDREMVAAAMEMTRAECKPYKLEHRIVRPGGEVRYVREHADCVADESGRLMKLIGTVQDITDYRLLEQQFFQAQKLESLGRLAGGVAHDFNNLITVISGFGDLALAGLQKTDPLYESLSEIRKAGDRAASLTQQLLAFSRKQLLQPVPLNINTVILEAEKLLRRLIGEDIDLRLQLNPSCGTVLADPGQIHQVIMNLVVNARDAMPRGGSVLIESDNVELDEGYTENRPQMRPGSYVLLAVSDTGVGMDDEVKSHLFDPFFTTKSRGTGTGLGLSTVYGIVKQTGGWIWVYSEIGKGSTFKIYLPRVRSSIVSTRQAPERVALTGTETVLVLEDQAEVRKLAVAMLRTYRYTVLQAATPEEALSIMAQSAESIDVVVTDVVMPGLSGPDFVEKIKAARPDIAVVFMSGYTEDASLLRGIISGYAVYLPKPFTAEQLAAKVREALARNKP
jgi:PAS domain S-box-containing protein